MKKLLSLGMAIVVLLSVLSFSVSKAQAAGIIKYLDGRFVWGKGVVFVFEASGYRNRDVKDANIFAGSNFYDLYCNVNKEEGRIICVARGDLTKYASQSGIIYLAGQIFYVTIPARHLPAETSLICGAYIEFMNFMETTETVFITGETMQEVSDAADAWLGQYWVNYQILSDEIECGPSDT